MTRTKILRICLLVAVAIIGIRLFYIQIIEHGRWAKEAEAQQTMQNLIVAERGKIYMLAGETPTPVVMNEPVWTVVIDPAIVDKKKVKKTVDKFAKMNRVASWEKVFRNKKTRYFVVAKNVKRREAEKIQGANLTGLWLRREVRRVYPEGQLGSGLLGFVNTEGKGQYGVEGSLNKALAGENGLLKTVKDVNNVPLTIGTENVRVPAKDGKNLVLTVDRNVQYNIEKILAKGLKRSGARHASAVVMSPTDGRIYAMATLPTYDAGNYSEVKDGRVFQNEPVENAYEPASVCKTFTFAAAINEGVMSPNTTYENKGYTTVDGWKIENAYKGQLGTVTMQTALNFSLNTGSTQALRLMGGDAGRINRTGREKLYDYYHKRFGFGDYTGVELLEVKGFLADPNKGQGLNSTYANMTFGQNLNLTMMQVAAAFSAVVNGGDYYIPQVVAGEMEDGIFKQKKKKPAVRKVISNETSETMRKMLYGARGSRRIYGIDKPGYYVGGKTGTAQVIKNGAYSLEETVASYVGFGGSAAELPEYVIMVKIWEEGKRIEGEKDAMPIFDEMSNYMQKYLKIEPKG